MHNINFRFFLCLQVQERPAGSVDVGHLVVHHQTGGGEPDDLLANDIDEQCGKLHLCAVEWDAQK